MKEKLRKLMLVICVCVFAYSAFQLGKIFYDYYKLEKATEGLVAEYVETIGEDYDPLTRVIRFDELKKKNEDVIGWIYIPDTKIDEPILKGKDNDSYIHTSIDKEYNFAGCIFIEENNNADFNDANTIIYGHNMKNGSRFHDIREYRSKDFFEKHPTVYIYLPDGTARAYDVYAMRQLSAYSDLYQINVDYNEYVKRILKGAKQRKDVSEEPAPLIMLSTCVNAESDERFIISARLAKTVKTGE